MNRVNVIGTLLVVASLCVPCMAGDEPKPPTRTISVMGTASVKVVPDEVTLTVGVTNTNLDLALAKKEVDAGIKKVMAVVKEMGIEAKDVQTDRLSMSPKYQYHSGADSDKPPTFLGYCVSNDVCIILRDTSKCEALITALFGAGINTVSDVTFQTSKLREHRDQARVMAVKLAKEKAALIAGEFGMKVGKPVMICEKAHSPYAMSYGMFAGGGPNATNTMAQAQRSVDDEEEASSPDEPRTVALGQLEVSATVEVTFELE